MNQLQKNQEYGIHVNAELLARYFKYYQQHIKPNVKYPLGLWKVRVNTLLKKDGKRFEKLSKILVKYNINHVKFMKFCVLEQRITKPSDILSGDVFAKFASYLKLKEDYKNIYTQYMKSAEYIADECISNRITPVEYIKSLVIDNRFAIEYISGHISKHFIASIHGFKKFFWKLDNINREELGIIYDVADTLNQNVQDAFLMFKNQRVAPINLIEKIIKQKQNN